MGKITKVQRIEKIHSLIKENQKIRLKYEIVYHKNKNNHEAVISELAFNHYVLTRYIDGVEQKNRIRGMYDKLTPNLLKQICEQLEEQLLEIF